ncbi:MAG: nucleoside-diphosphate kinase [archaeon]
MTIQKTLVLVKPDGVQRTLVGKIITRFEDAGLKIIGMKMKWVDKKFAEAHYTDDISKRRGEHVRKVLLKYIQEGPVVAIVLEGINAIEIVRKIVGDTEPRQAPPGTIRGDFAHVSYAHADEKEDAIRNLIHASGNEQDAKAEVKLWFTDKELHTYSTVHDMHII